MNSISESTVSVNRIRATLAMIIITFLCGGIFVFFPTLSLALEGLFLVVYIYCILIFLKKHYESYYYQADKNCVKIKKGVFLSREITLYKQKIQYTKLVQTPIERIFKTCTIIYHTAGAIVYLSEIDEAVSDGVMFND